MARKPVFWFALALLVVGGVIGIVKVARPNLDIPATFPISMVDPHWNVLGLFWAAAFFALLAFGVAWVVRLRGLAIWGLGLALILTGNLIQGGVGPAFYRPLAGTHNVYKPPIQYLHAAMAAGDLGQWLRDYNRLVPDMHKAHVWTHARTHPPFTTMLHGWLFRLGGLPLLAGVLILFASFIVPVVRATFLTFCPGGERAAGLMGLLFAVFPAGNIYGAVVVDGAIATLSALFLLALAKTIKGGLCVRWMAVLVASALAMNLLTYAGLFLYGVVLVLVVWKKVDLRVLLWLCGSAVAAWLALKWSFGYDQLAALRAVVITENAANVADRARTDGVFHFQALANPMRYWFTRAEDIGEIGLFASFSVLGALCWRYLKRSCAAAAALGVLGFMFLLGMWPTGETARTCLFIYPWAFLLLPTGENVLRPVVWGAGIQTLVMQIVACYFF